MKAVALRLLLNVTNTMKWLILCFLSLITGTGMLYDHFEGKQFWDSLWWAVVTATTVGYGDLYPKTAGGRMAGMFLMLGMVLVIIPLITAQAAAKLIVDSNAFTNDEQEELKHNVQLIAELLTHVTSRSCMCIWDDHDQPLVVSPLCVIHGGKT